MKFKEQAIIITTIIAIFLLLAPIVFMFITPIPMLITQQKLMIDFLIPLEVFPIVFTGAGLLTLIACKTDIYKRKVCALVILMIVMFFGGQYLAVVTGIADGSASAAGLAFIVVVLTTIAYDVLTFITGIYGLRIYKLLKVTT